MRYIAHRGNLIGPYPELENRPDYILNAIDCGFDCECDVWWHEGGWWLGHDSPLYKITDPDFLESDGLWIHAKNSEALTRIQQEYPEANYFWHETDDYTLTSKGYIWAYPGSRLTKETVCVMPENADYTKDEKFKAWAICSDYIILEKLEEIRRNT
jgi:hypothetical protein